LIFSIQEFNDEVERAVYGAIYSVVGDTGLRTLHNHLKTYYGMTPEEIPYRLESLFEALDHTIGLREARRLGMEIARRVYYRYSIDFRSIEGYALKDYLEEAKRVLSQLQEPVSVLKA